MVSLETEISPIHSENADTDGASLSTADRKADVDVIVARPITASLGINPGWCEAQAQAEVELPPVPEFSNATEIARIAVMFTLWARVEEFLYDECKVAPLKVIREEKKHLSILRESETSIVCLLCLLNNDHYSASGLVDAMIGEYATADQRGNARKRLVNRSLPVLSERYKLLKLVEVGKGSSREYRICRSERLVKFAETHLVTAVRGLMGDLV